MPRLNRSGEFVGRRRQSTDAATLVRHFGTADLLPLWIAEPSVGSPPCVQEALETRSSLDWFGYETRPESVIESFWEWMQRRHGWDGLGLHAAVSPSVGSSIGALIDLLTDPGDGVIIQPPVFTDFKTIISDNERAVVKNPLRLTGGRYSFELDGLEALAADPTNRLLILCSPHNPVGRVWTQGELASVAAICAEHDVFVLADEIHADLALPPHRSSRSPRSRRRPPSDGPQLTGPSRPSASPACATR